jgi:uncharacterized protein YukE
MIRSGQLVSRISLLLIGLLLIAGCASNQGQQSTAKSKTTPDTEYTEEDLHQDLLNYASRFDAVIRSTSSRIAKRSDDQEIQRRSLLWKIRLIPLASELAVQSNPQESYLDLSLLTEMMKQYLTTGEGKNIFGPHQELAREASRELEAKILEIGTKFLSEKRMKKFRKQVRESAKDHTIRGENFSVESFKSYVQKVEDQRNIFRSIVNVPLSPFNALQGVGSTPTAIQEVNKTMEDMIEVVEGFPKVVRWQTELLLYNLENRETVDEILAQTQKLNETADELTSTFQKYPSDLERLLKKSSPQLQQANETSKQLNKLVGQTRSLMKQVQKTSTEWKPLIESMAEQNGEDDASSEGPGLKEFRATMKQTNRSVKNLRKLAVELKNILESDGLEKTPSRLKSLGTHTRESSQQLIDYAFLRAIQLLGLLFAALLLYRTVVYFCFTPTD